MATGMREKLADLTKSVVKLRKADKSWAEIADELEVTPGKAMLAYEFHLVDPKDVVVAKTDEAMGKAIVKLRDNEGLSWGKISAKTDMGEQACRSLYETTKGETTKGNRIGKGGRYPSDGSGTAPAKKVGGVKKVAKKAPAKKVAPVKKTTGTSGKPAAKKAVAKKVAGVKKTAKASKPEGQSAPASDNKPHALAGMDYDALVERLEGRKIQYSTSEGALKHIEIRTVKTLDGDNLEVIDAASGNSRTIRVTSIVRASK